MRLSSTSLVEAAKARNINLLTLTSAVDYGLNGVNRNEVFALYVFAINECDVTAQDLHRATQSSEDSSGLNEMLGKRAAGIEMDRVKQLGGIKTIYD